MTMFRIRKLMGFAMVTTLMLSSLACGEETQPSDPDTEPGPDTTAVGCTAPADWFPHSQTPAPNDTATFAINCDFHQWSWQSFLWLTQSMPNGELRFETFASPEQLAVPGGGAPPAFSEAAAGPLKLIPRVAKSDDPTLLDEINQAGSLGLLIDQSGRAVYYALYINDIFYEFVRENGLYNPDSLAAAPDTLNFPVGALELKASWKVVSPGDDTTGYYTRQAEVAKLVEQNGSVVVDPNETLQVTVVLVGLHIAGVVKDHPEFIWATFEHQQNAPTLTDAQLTEYLDANNDTINDQPVSGQNFTFYRAGTTFIESNENNAGEVQLVDADAQTLTPVSNIFIQYAQGGGNAQNRTNIVDLNDSVLSQLQDPVANQYYLGGAIWLNAKNGLVPNSTQQDLITGSTDLSNSSIESFTQKVVDQRNCFNCHNTLQRFPPVQDTNIPPLPGKNLNLSHILVNHYFQASQRQEGSDE